ncbi:hypothetical protein RA27_00635 [Ruegeria sp. ANG-R]|nr:hypothetical protein RA27_00635 [Ruegeria sp. ANG-R]
MSRRLGELEDILGLRLLQRTTRDLFLTPAGRELYIRAERIAADVEATWGAMKQFDEEPQGVLRVSVPDSELAAVPLFTDFAAEFPKVELDVLVANVSMDLRAEGIDVALVFDEVGDPSLIAKSMYFNRNFAMATKSYRDKFGLPERPEDLQNHDCIVMRDNEGMPQLQWPLTNGETIKVKPKMLASGFRLMVQAVYAGLGIGLLPENALVKNKDLIALFPDLLCRESHFRLVYVEREYQLPHVRAFIERSDKFWNNWLTQW